MTRETPTADEVAQALAAVAAYDESAVLRMVDIARPFVDDADEWLASVRSRWTATGLTTLTPDEVTTVTDAVMALARAGF